MEFCNPKCPQPRRGQNCGGCMPDTSCGMPPKTIMPCPSASAKCDKNEKRMPERNMASMMPDQNMANMMPNQNMANTMPDRNMVNMMPNPNMANTMPERNMANMMSDQNMVNMMPNPNMANTMPNRNMANMMPERSMGSGMPNPNMTSTMPGWDAGNMSCNMGLTQPDNSGCWDHFPIAMAYVPWQRWQQPYPIEHGFKRGTIFPDLDLPFVMGRCQ